MKAKQKAKQKPKPSPSVKQSAGKDKAGKAKAKAEPSSQTAKPKAKIRRKSQKSILNGYIRAKVSDSFLTSIAKSMLRNLNGDELQNIHDNIRRLAPIPVASFFSGSEIQCLAGRAIFDIMGFGADAYIVKYTAEIGTKKRAWIQALQEAIGCSACIYGDLGTIRRVPDCTHHGRACKLGRAKLAVGGWSCKDLSKLSAAKAKGQTKTCLETGCEERIK